CGACSPFSILLCFIIEVDQIVWGGSMRSELFAFHRGVIDQSDHAPSEQSLKKLCEAKVRHAPTGASGYLAFAGFRKGDAALAIMTSDSTGDVRRRIWLRPRFVDKKNPPPGFDLLTLDWGYVFDRNGDGRVDYFAFLIGPMSIAPRGDEALRFANRFWEVIDSDFNGEADSLIVPAIRESDGGVEGAMLLEGIAKSGEPSACCWGGESGSADIKDCRPTARGCRSLDNSLTAASDRFPPAAIAFVMSQLPLVNSAAAECNLKPPAIPRGPRRY
ncbi:hypothetical protein M1105_18560, partial [Limibaculum sp. FT325]|uniref:hypothetical protein n=1 Tax=Thermohalobaculum sediminis TaxID=2939436 RepID=UPI0020C072F0